MMIDIEKMKKRQSSQDHCESIAEIKRECLEQQSSKGQERAFVVVDDDDSQLNKKQNALIKAALEYSRFSGHGISIKSKSSSGETVFRYKAAPKIRK